MRAVRDQAGFTLVELMIVVAIMGILTTVVIKSKHLTRMSDAARGPMDRLQRQTRLADLLRPDARAARAVSVSKDGQTLVLSGRAGGKVTYSFSQGRLLRQSGRGSAKEQALFLAGFHCSVQNGPNGAQLLKAQYRLEPGSKDLFPLFEMVQP